MEKRIFTSEELEKIEKVVLIDHYKNKYNCYYPETLESIDGQVYGEIWDNGYVTMEVDSWEVHYK
jgi:hypothetical protein